jgi:hypothetical protein
VLELAFTPFKVITLKLRGTQRGTSVSLRSVKS